MIFYTFLRDSSVRIFRVVRRHSETFFMQIPCSFTIALIKDNPHDEISTSINVMMNLTNFWANWKIQHSQNDLYRAPFSSGGYWHNESNKKSSILVPFTVSDDISPNPFAPPQLFRKLMWLDECECFKNYIARLTNHQTRLHNLQLCDGIT